MRRNARSAEILGARIDACAIGAKARIYMEARNARGANLYSNWLHKLVERWAESFVDIAPVMSADSSEDVTRISRHGLDVVLRVILARMTYVLSWFVD